MTFVTLFFFNYNNHFKNSRNQKKEVTSLSQKHKFPIITYDPQRTSFTHLYLNSIIEKVQLAEGNTEIKFGKNLRKEILSLKQ